MPGEQGLDNQLIIPPETREKDSFVQFKEAKLAAYQSDITSLLEKVTAGRLSSEEMATLLSRSMLAKDLVAERYYLRAMVDPLTDLPNRRAVTERFESLVSSGTPFGRIDIDIDRFKNLNDGNGHQFGDQVLTEFGRVAGRQIRQAPIRLNQTQEDKRRNKNMDMLGRNGGEEFVILLPGIDSEDQVLTVGEKVRTAIEEHPFMKNQNGVFTRIPVTISAGAGIFRGGNPQEFVKKVDAGLYDAKNGGRNRVIVVNHG